MSSCSSAVAMWYRHERILLIPILSPTSAQISRQPTPNAQWHEPHCEDPTLSSDRATRWTAQQQEGTWYQCQQSDLTHWELVLCVCMCGGREYTVQSDCWEHMCWRQPECALKWRLMNEDLVKCVQTRLKGQHTRRAEHKHKRVCMWWFVGKKKCAQGYIVSFDFSPPHIPQLWGAEWHERDS